MPSATPPVALYVTRRRWEACCFRWRAPNRASSIRGLARIRACTRFPLAGSKQQPAGAGQPQSRRFQEQSAVQAPSQQAT
jgi:hypothetical protein